MVKRLESVKKEKLAEVNAEANVLPVVGEHNIESLLQEGVIVRLNIGRWRGKTSISDNDFNLNGDTKKLFRLGEKFLLPQEALKKLQSIEMAARRLVNGTSIKEEGEDGESVTKYKLKYGFRSPAGIFIPIKNLRPLMEELASLRNDYFAARDNIMVDFDRLKAEAVRDFAEWIRTNFGNDTKLRERFLNDLEAATPKKEDVKASFYFNIIQDIVILPTEKSRITESYLEGLKDEETRAALQNVAAKYAESVKEEMALYSATIFDQLRSDVFDVIEDALNAVNMEGELPSGKVNKIKHLWEQVSRLNFFGDQDLQTQIDYINSLLSGKKTNRDSSIIKDKLVKLAELTKESAEKIKDLNSRGAFLEF